ncbi:MAG: hypothetical protein QOH68_526 [Nocardioidaceae bacterium]|nr:hypothetical protein [Nocardioidaceae bacterium]
MNRYAVPALVAALILTGGCGGGSGSDAGTKPTNKATTSKVSEKEDSLVRAVQTGDDFVGLRDKAAPSALDDGGKLREAVARCVAKQFFASGISDQMIDAYIDDRFDEEFPKESDMVDGDLDKLNKLAKELPDTCDGFVAG